MSAAGGPRYRTFSDFDPPSVLSLFRADDLDVERADAGAARDGAPRITRELYRVDGVGDDDAAQLQVVFGDGISGADSPGVFDGCGSSAERRIPCSMESMRRYTALMRPASARAIVVLPLPGRPLKMMSMF